ncbi:MAG: ATP-binding protein [Sinobacteraceae bacterium]|nr:ATP-binding protein [Nevskiaceae bacterium]MCP5338694.1 ATP-binding protein [Nevskiaceae bacterium]
MTVDYEKLGVFYLGREYDAAAGALRDELVLYNSKDLTTHAVCVGMTGSGKTGLCVSLLEEAAIDGIPAICIDPKGDLGNLLLNFPSLSPQEFEPWVDPAEAQRKGLSVEQLAAQTAATWKNGLAEWAQTPERVARLRDAVDVAIYTPGAETGLPLSVLRSFAPPPAELLADSTALRDRVTAVVSGLLSLLGRDADPLQSREHILLANILEHAWRDGTTLDMAGLIGAVQKPAFDKVGAFDLETFFPAKDRLALAMAINNLLASPGFSTWMKGEPLDIQRLLFTPAGKPRISILSIGHLSDPERMFIVTLVLNELLGWMRNQSGTSSLRALFYMDEIFGYFPPSANPPSKLPMLTLLKQARAFGLGCVLATQNPVDLDYKGLSNCGTWMIGRLQTERDKLRVIEGLESAVSGSGTMDRSTLEKLMSALAPRVFLMRNVHDDTPYLMKSRWALSFLRGPLTGAEITRVMAPRKAAQAAAATGAAAAAAPGTPASGNNPIGTAASPSPTAGDSSSPSAATTPRPLLPAEVSEYFLAGRPGDGPLSYRPMVMGNAKLHFIDSKLGLDQWTTTLWLAPLADDGQQALWAEGSAQDDRLRNRLSKLPAAAAADYAALPGPALRAATWSGYGKTLAAHLFENARSTIQVCDALKTSSAPGESEGDFRARLGLMLREKRDAGVENLRRKLTPKLQTLQDRIARAEERLAREQAQLKQQKLQTALSVGSSILGAMFGRKTMSAGNIGRATSAARSASRIGRESADVDRADESLEVLRQRLTTLQQEGEAEIAKLAASLEETSVALRSVAVAPRKSDLAIGEVALVWMPWRRGNDGFPAPAYD